MADSVSISEFVRRITFLSARFPDYKIKVYTYYHHGIYDELKKLKIPFEEYHGYNYDSYAEDICDVGIFLNPDKTEILDFTKDLENNKLFWGGCYLCIDKDNDMLRVIFEKPQPKSLVIENIKEFVKEMMGNIFINHEPLVFKKVTTSKRKYENIVKDEGNEIIKNYYEITQIKTKKIKLE